jgi:hypothetical protein
VIFNPPPGWPKPPSGWQPPAGWTPDPSWPPAPAGWQLWLGEGIPSPASWAAEVPEPSIHPDVERVHASRIAFLEAENAALRQRVQASTGDSPVELDDARVLQDVGIYRYHHPLESAAAYQDRLADLETRIAEVIKSDKAIAKSELFTFNNSLSQGRKMTSDLGKLMLRAYNAETDNALRTLRAGNVVTAKRRLEASRAAIVKLGALMEMRIDDAFHDLRIEEVELTADWLMKKQQEREDAREERARLKEEEKVRRELEEERAKLDKERAHIAFALDALAAKGEQDPELLERLAAIDVAIADNDFRAANVRAGYVYVISNEGAFGHQVVKIGLTRRLRPLERIAELSGASVPFRFDVHTLYFSEDAVNLENELHKHFSSRAVNQANFRKEFFFATPAEVRDVLLEKVGNLLEFTEAADATEYRQSRGAWPEGILR